MDLYPGVLAAAAGVRTVRKSRVQPGQVLAGRAGLAGDGRGERPARRAGGVELHPFGVYVEFHADPRTAADQRHGHRQAGLADMLAAYMSSPEAFSPRALRATYSTWPMVPPHRHHLSVSGVRWPFQTSGHRFCRTL